MQKQKLLVLSLALQLGFGLLCLSSTRIWAEGYSISPIKKIRSLPQVFEASPK